MQTERKLLLYLLVWIFKDMKSFINPFFMTQSEDDHIRQHAVSGC